jgi:hypothetical protein
VMNLKCPTRLSQRPRQRPLGFIEMTSMTSPRWKVVQGSQQGSLTEGEGSIQDYLMMTF